ncbi:phosphoglycerate dehydrogenase [Clostridium sp. MT-14]|jgi:phosphoglycerate dehydrogenase-like enzyme|uniref:Phosphoglycerate dehydrogenase n=1 Tax=Clostridium aromativorans TaxID=2836848 RepID=A0ABS8N3Y3_9CLOT|nr:phosphoglycerate dehydrogenase [Clostridium aromativorans]MCC9294492.1 phosphoglycerate dehydrogenase [Clostridium aromativorans]CAB1254971.1 (S)-sulfolactate dehydrogenase [Clostridiaceae bacterium BL-3]
MGIKLLCTRNFGDKNIANIKKLGYDVKIVGENGARYTENMKDTEVLLCYDPFKTLDISGMKNLKWIQLFSIGIDQLPMDVVKKNHILITNNKGGYSIPMGEWIVLKILEMLRHSRRFYENQRNRLWKLDTGILELWGKTVGFIGTGSIAKEAAKRLVAFDVKIVGLNTKGEDVAYFNQCFSSEQIKDMLKLCDIVVITIPYTKKTCHMIDGSAFRAMKNGVYIVNTARGSIMDESAFIENVKNKKILGAALDVVEEEPLDKDNPLWEFENVIITPHNSWVSERADIRRFNMIYNNLKRYVSGDKLDNLVDVYRGY